MISSQFSPIVDTFSQQLCTVNSEDQPINIWINLIAIQLIGQETEEWCYREKLKIDNEWQRLNKLSEET